MHTIMNRPIFVFVSTVVLLWGATQLGTFFHRHRPDLNPDEREDFNVVLTATLTLLGLIIGFTFSMAVSRYDQRKNLEEAEANAIGTEYVRAELLPANDAARIRDLLRAYLDQRILFYKATNATPRLPIDAATAKLQDDLWAAVRVPATAQPTPLSAVAVMGMNDVLNSQGYTQAAWWNRIPLAAWLMLFLIAICANVMIGFGAHSRHPGLFFVLPLVAGVSFFLIADIDSPRGGTIRVRPQNLEALAESFRAQ
jgi:hypothetical protein